MRRFRLLLIAGAVLLGLYATHTAALARLGRWLNVAETPQRADYVLVLNGQAQRAAVGAALVKTGFAQQALIVAMNPNSSPSQADSAWPQWDEISRRILVARGVPADRIAMLQPACQTTADEALALARFLEAHPTSKVLVVTSDLHTRRAQWIFRERLGERADQVRFVAAPEENFDHTNWWRVEQGFVAYVSEYMKLAFYLAYYGHVVRWVAAIAALVCLGGLIVARRPKGSSCAVEGLSHG